MSDNRPVGGEALTKLTAADIDAWVDYVPVNAKHEHIKLRHAFMAGRISARSAQTTPIATVAPPATPALEAGGEAALGPCRVCGRVVGASAWLCDRESLPACEECQPKTPCGREEHGEGCPTHVFSDQPSAKHEAEHRYPLVGGYKSYMLAAQQAFVAGAEWSAALTPPRGSDQSGGVALEAREDGR